MQRRARRRVVALEQGALERYEAGRDRAAGLVQAARRAHAANNYGDELASGLAMAGGQNLLLN